MGSVSIWVSCRGFVKPISSLKCLSMMFSIGGFSQEFRLSIVWLILSYSLVSSFACLKIRVRNNMENFRSEYIIIFSRFICFTLIIIGVYKFERNNFQYNIVGWLLVVAWWIIEFLVALLFFVIETVSYPVRSDIVIETRSPSSLVSFSWNI